MELARLNEGPKTPKKAPSRDFSASIMPLRALLVAAMCGTTLAVPQEARTEVIYDAGVEIDALSLKNKEEPTFAYGGHLKTRGSFRLVGSEANWISGFTFLGGINIPLREHNRLAILLGPGGHIALEGFNEWEFSMGIEGSSAGTFEVEEGRFLSTHIDFEALFARSSAINLTFLHEVYFRMILDFTEDGHGFINPIIEVRGLNEVDEDAYANLPPGAEATLADISEETVTVRGGVGFRLGKEAPAQLYFLGGAGVTGQKFSRTGLASFVTMLRFDFHGHDHDHDEHDEGEDHAR